MRVLEPCMLLQRSAACTGCNNGLHLRQDHGTSHAPSASPHQGLYQGGDFGEGVLQHKAAALRLLCCRQGRGDVGPEGLQLHEAVRLGIPSLRRCCSQIWRALPHRPKSFQAR